MTRPARRRPREPRGLTALVDFARGYLHEDLLAEHGSAAAAVAAFCQDASPDERRRLADDLVRLAVAARAWPPARLSRFFSHDLGAAWTPQSLDDVRELEALARPVDDRRS